MVELVGNHSFGPEAHLNQISYVLKATTLNGDISPRVDLVPDVFITFDHEGEIEGAFSSPEGSLLSMSYRVIKPPRWVALHFAMGDVDFSGHSVLGIVARSEAPVATMFRMCVRSGTEDGFSDCFFSKHVVSFSEVSTHIDLLRFGQDGKSIPSRAPWRELILFFKIADQKLTVNDLKIFSV